MRVGMISPLDMRVPPVAYGGTELVVSLLVEELVRQGHDVTLFASGDSRTSANLVPGCTTFLRGSGRNVHLLNMLNVMACFERGDEFDIIHNHTTLEGMSAAGLIDTPVITTLHGGFEGDWQLLFQRYKGWYNTISSSAASMLPPSERSAGVIYNAIDVESYPFNPGPREEFALFLSRISAEKGTHLAIDAALQANHPLVIAGNVDTPDQEYFERKVLPQVDGDLIRYVGEADTRQKHSLLSRAKCLLAPITWEEPFGLFLIEAMACGTPVIAFARGAAPELVIDGQTGYVVNDVHEMARAISKVERINPYLCRTRVETHFNVERMANDYVSAYWQILSKVQRSPGLKKGTPTLTA